MTDRFDGHAQWSSPYLCVLMFVIPLLFAAGITEQSGQHVILPDEDSYRSNFSETILESLEWRKPPPTEFPWRTPPRPELGWRTPPSTQPSTTSPRSKIELFPKYRPGAPTDFDHIQREEKPLIKVFEFGS
ncbi:MAG: hypothetical protein NPIRA02_04910 [Nitrospirales bacterium]|nr:MAG: hypothetical protein NPIRA02_04910 [Nitrospirales bacterium]